MGGVARDHRLTGTGANGYAGCRPQPPAPAPLSTLRKTFAELHQTLREPRDEILLELGADGEVLLARLRLLIATLLIVLPARFG